MAIRLSSGTWAIKVILPAVGVSWLVMCILALFGIVPLNSGRAGLIVLLVVLLILNAFAFYFAFSAKHVWVGQGHLIIKGGSKEEWVDLADVVSVTRWPVGRIAPIWVTFWTPTAFGQSVVFWTISPSYDTGGKDMAERLRNMVARAKARRKAGRSVQSDAASHRDGHDSG